jgi:aspartate aminotransferase-like enzyme
LEKIMNLPLAHVDPDGLQEFSVVFTDRSLNHMSARFGGAMREISTLLRGVYGASAMALIPGGGSYAMEAAARQFGQGRNLVVRNGWFSYRWSQIFDACQIGETHVVMAARQGNSDTSPYAPPPIETVVAQILQIKPQAVFAPHVETSAGIILPDDYIMAMAAAAHEVGALMVLDCIASGCAWVDMAALGVDVLISAPQKGWSASPSAGVVMLSPAAEARLETTTSNSFAIDLKKWRAIMATFEGGGHAYHATMPTDAIMGFHAAILETQEMGFAAAKSAQYALGDLVRADLAARGVLSVAASGFGAPGVVVSYTADPAIQNGSAFRAQGFQIAAGVPLQVGEGEGFRTFRLGLFGLDKLADPAATLARLAPALDVVLGEKR